MEKQKAKRGIVTAMLFFLYRALKACQSLDPEVCRELEALPENLIIVIGLEDEEGGIAFMRQKKTLNRVWVVPEQKSQPAGSTFPLGNVNDRLEIRFKTVGAALRVVFGRVSIGQSYARNDILVSGEIRWAMILVRCIRIVQNYLFPARIRDKLFELPPKRVVPSTIVYLKMLFQHE